LNKKYKRKLIIGIDPGISCGIAIIDFNAKPILLDSKKGIAINDAIKIISNLGTPEIIASDVNPMPQFVKKIATKLNAQIFTPRVPMTGIKKRELVTKYLSNQGIRLKNLHIFDALSAALKARNYYKNKFDQIDALKIKSEIELNVLKSSLIKGIKIKEAIKSFDEKEPKKAPRIKRLKKLDKNDSHKKIVKLIKKINRLILDNEDLQKEVTNLQSEIQFLKDLLKKNNEEFEIEARKDRIIQLQKREIENLSLELRKLKKPISSKKIGKNLETIQELAQKGEIIILKPIKKFTFDHVEEAIRDLKISIGDIPILLDSSGGGRSTSQILIKSNIRAIIAGNPMSHGAEDQFFENDIPILKSEKIQVKWAGRIPYVNAKDINDAIVEIKSRSKKVRNKLKESIILNSEEL